ncbi:GMC family oxidoreductase [Undibacterium fentianense]|uniref:GMC family oxidoreductase n=1 Tax=Undibacterium fentianense TaxID=2828728 RepID=A0A941E7T7_9BURK|nr:GMC family oxidoreductase [Undibacterium fentianense]MBR7800273.1 GMC family oxidoreductase [Undibacterium fentianense]
MNKNYDVVIVGTGIAGAVLAKTLTQAGKSVLMLEAGLEAGIALNPERAYNNYQQYLQTFYSKANKATNGPYPDIKDAESPDVLEIKAQTPYDSGYLVQMGPLPFASDCLRGAGGTTLHWLGNVPRMLPNDFRMQSLYGQGVDWPISYQDLMPYYEMAENEIGVSGDVDAQLGPDMNRSNYGPNYVFPMHKIPQSYQDKIWMQNTENLSVILKGKQYNITCVSMPQGRNSDPNLRYRFSNVTWDVSSQKLVLQSSRVMYQVTGSVWSPYSGERCEGNASCVPICPVQAKYNALKTLKKSDFSNLEIRTQAVASELIVDGNSKEITGIVYKRYEHGDSPRYQTEIANGKLYVLAASALENAKILLASNAANSSDQVGRNLMDHLVLLTWGLFPEKVYPYRGPGCTTYIPTFRDGEFRKDFAAWISPLDNWGWSWPTFAPGTDVQNALNRNLFGQQLRDFINDRVTRQALLHFECEQAPEQSNRMTIDPRYKDQLDNYRPVIHYDASAYMRKSFEAAKTVSDQIFAANRIEDYTEYKPSDADYVIWEGRGYTFRGAGHIVGTHRMGNDPSSSVVKPTQQTWDHPNLYLVGCGNMPTLGTSNPTLTMTALTFMAAENILQHLSETV